MCLMSAPAPKGGFITTRSNSPPSWSALHSRKSEQRNDTGQAGPVEVRRKRGVQLHRHHLQGSLAIRTEGHDTREGFENTTGAGARLQNTHAHRQACGRPCAQPTRAASGTAAAR